MFLDHSPAVGHHYTVPEQPAAHTILFVTRHHQTPCSANDSNLIIDYGKSQTIQGGLSNEEGYNELTKDAKELAKLAPEKLRLYLKEILDNNLSPICLGHVVETSTLSRCIQTALPLAQALAKGGFLYDLTDSSSPYQILGNSLYQSDCRITASKNLIHIPIKNGHIDIKGVTADLCKIWISEDPVRIEIEDAEINEDLFTIIVEPLDLALIDVVINGLSISLNPDWREVIHGWADGRISASHRNKFIRAFDEKMKELAKEFFPDNPIDPDFQTLFNPLNIVADLQWKGPRPENIQEVVERAFTASRTTAQRHPNKLVLVVSSTGFLQSFMTSEKRRQENSVEEFPLYYFGQFLQGSQGCLIKVDSNGSVTYDGPINATQTVKH